MIDWVSFSVPYCGPEILGGFRFAVDEAGQEKWCMSEYKRVTGSWDFTVSVKGEGGSLYISGNPAKFVSGQNLFYTDDLRSAVRQFLENLLPLLGLDRTPLFRLDQVRLHRVDITRNFRLGCQADVSRWLVFATQYAKGRYQKASTDGGTVYIGKHSRRKAWKFYDKLAEVVKNRSDYREAHFGAIANEAKHLLRSELVVRGMWLRSKIVDGNHYTNRPKSISGKYYKKHDDQTLEWLKNWGEDMAQVIYLNELKQTNLPEEYCQVIATDDLIDRLPRHLAATYLMWSQGYNVESALPKRTYYRHRGELKKWGVDIKHEPIRETATKTFPVLSVLTGKEYIPSEEYLRVFGLDF